MALFNFEKKANKESKSVKENNFADSISLIVLGSGCKSCKQLYENALSATSGTGVKLDYVTDLEKIMEYGVMSMPALVINGSVVSSGKILNVAEIVDLINKEIDNYE